MRRPSQGFDGSCMLMELTNVFIHSGLPNKYQVIISTWGEEIIVSWPFKSAYLLFVAFKTISNSLGPDIPNQNFAVFGASGNEVAIAIDINTANPSKMFLITMGLDFLLNIDDSNSASLLPHQEAFSPFDTTDVTLDELLGFVAFCRPNIGCVIKHDTDDILFAPVQKICVKVVFEFWGV